jgi:hypothetical protein
LVVETREKFRKRSEIGFEGVDWTHQLQNRDQWRTIVNTITNFGFP